MKRVAIELGFDQISLSSEIAPMIRMVPRGCTTCVDAYLTPVIKRYLLSFSKGFDANLPMVQLSFMQSDGGLTPMNSFYGNKAILSGPAGGVVGYAVTSFVSPEEPVIGFDMGGTSTDVSRYAGAFEHIFEGVTAGVTIQSPQLDINTVAAGGGSRLFFRRENKLFVVGPESAGAHPGPSSFAHYPRVVSNRDFVYPIPAQKVRFAIGNRAHLLSLTRICFLVAYNPIYSHQYLVRVKTNS